MKKIILTIIVLIAVGYGLFSWFDSTTNQRNDDQEILARTLDISRRYVALRYQSDHLLIDAESYANYEVWNQEMTALMGQWLVLEQEAELLEGLAKGMMTEDLSFKLLPTALAYNNQEISDVFDRAPAGKKIATLAKHLGVDAKTAFKILQQDQAQVEADAWNEAGDTFQTLENSATVIKDACKVAGYVGTIAATGGTSALASASTLSQAAVLVSGADLTLEVTSDAARISLGNSNKISAVIDTARIVTEPAAAILSISSAPENIASGFDKFNAVMLGADQLNSAVQDGKIAGIKLPAYNPENIKAPIVVSSLSKEELSQWLKEQGVKDGQESPSAVASELTSIIKQMPAPVIDDVADNEKPALTTTTSSSALSEGVITGIWEGILHWTPSADAAPETANVILELRADNTIDVLSGDWNASSWSQEANIIKFYGDDKAEGYNEFVWSGKELTFVKTAGPDQEDPTQWVEVMAGSDFFGGKYLEINFQKQN